MAFFRLFLMISAGLLSLHLLVTPSHGILTVPQFMRQTEHTRDSDVVDEQSAQQILQATVQIGMYEFERGAGYEAGGRSLGTIATYAGETIVLTHDHFQHLTPNLKVVEFHNAWGDLVLAIGGDAFRELIQYRDGGVMILTAPHELARHFIPARLETTDATFDDDSLLYTVRRPDPSGLLVDVVATKFDALEHDNLPARLRLRALAGATLSGGDSGGGVWVDGRVLGSVWSSGLRVRRTSIGNRTFPGYETPTNLIVAALHPFPPDDVTHRRIDQP